MNVEGGTDESKGGARNISETLSKKVPSPFMEKGFRDEGVGNVAALRSWLYHLACSDHLVRLRLPLLRWRGICRWRPFMHPPNRLKLQNLKISRRKTQLFERATDTACRTSFCNKVSLCRYRISTLHFPSYFTMHCRSYWRRQIWKIYFRRLEHSKLATLRCWM